MGDIVTNVERIKLHNEVLHTLKQTDLWDNRLINCVLKLEEQKNILSSEDFYPVDLTLYYSFGLIEGSRKKTFEKLIESAKRLRDAAIEIRLADGSILYGGLFAAIQYNTDPMYMRIKWNDYFLPLISGKMEAGKFLFPSVEMVKLPERKYSLYLLIEKNLYKLDKNESFLLQKEVILSSLRLEFDSKMAKTFKEVSRLYIKPTLKALYLKTGISLTYKVIANKVEFRYVT